MKSAKEVLESVSIKKKLKTNKLNTYKLTHTYDIDKTVEYYVNAPYTLEVFEVLCAYIQYECAEIDQEYSMGQDDIINIMTKFYGCEGVVKPDGRYREIDLYKNWEIYCSLAGEILSLETLKSDGLTEELRYILETYYANAQ